MLVRLLKIFLSLLVALADWSRAKLNRLLRRPPSASCVVLYYHAIRSEERQRFAWQMDELLRLTSPIDIADSQLEPGRRYSAVTFDDGFVSVIDNALPELSARRIPCTIFVPTGPLGRRPTWVESSHYDAGETIISADMVATIARQPLVKIGSHSVSHPNFSRLTDEHAKAELTESKAFLERLTGSAVPSFSFPHGAYTPRSLALAKACGYARVFTIEPVQLVDHLDQFTVGRVRVEPGDWPIEFQLKSIGAYRWMVRASAVKRELSNLFRNRRMPSRSVYGED